MKISGPERYSLTFAPDRYAVVCSRGTHRFSGIASSKTPKVYIVSVDGRPIYVGQTMTRMSVRLRMGWKADGTGGYHGYAWRHGFTRADLDIWSHEDAPQEAKRQRDMETIEAEIVYLIRLRTGKWPEFQTEIHFYQSNDEHRRIAASIADHYSLLKPSHAVKPSAPTTPR